MVTALLSTRSIQHPRGGAVSVGRGGVSYRASEEFEARGLGFAVRAEGRVRRARFTRAEPVSDGVDAWAETGLAGLTVQTRVRFVPDLAAVTVTHVLHNGTDRALPVTDIETGLFARDADLRIPTHTARDLRFCHTDNLRTERFPHSQGEFPYVRNLPVEPRLLGIGEDQPFPGVLLTERSYRHGWVFAAASQDKTFLSWRMQKGIKNRRMEQFTIRHEFPQARDFRLGPGESLELDGIFIQALEKTHPQDAYKDYLNWLSARIPLRGARTPLLREGMFCSWNYGRFRNQDSAELLETARFIAAHFPRLTYFLVDAGYLTTPTDTGLGNDFLDRFYPDPGAAVDTVKFPHGMRAFTDKIRALGLKPGIWWTPMARLDSALYREHPEWFLDDGRGGHGLIGSNGYLDLTVEAACEFVDRVLKTILRDWGMSAIKMDFWSQSVESRQARVRTLGMTALDARRFLFDRVRAHLPADGVFLTCVAVGMGNPFGGIQADAYRNSLDIGAGAWHEQLENCCWSLPMLGLEGRKSFLLDTDSAGIRLDRPENENFFRLTWCFITMGMQEIGGQLEKLPKLYIDALRRFTDRCDRGYRCLCPDERAFTGEAFPDALYVDYPEGSPTRAAGIRQSVALFNWTDNPRIVSVSRRALGHAGPVKAVNFWTGEAETFGDAFICRELAGRSARLYDILIK
jgi:hypothetical protein